MESIDTELAARIRNDIVLGNYGEEERISEVQLCNTHKVSRTPVRLALRMLEHEGLIRRSEGRGYFVNAPIDVRLRFANDCTVTTESSAAFTKQEIS